MGDAEGFDALFRRHHDAVLRYALRRVDPDGAADVVSDVFLVAWRRRDVEPVDQLRWLLGVARRVIANSRRSTSRLDALHLRLAHEHPSVGGDHAADIADRDRWQRAVAKLSGDDQEVLALVAWDQLPAGQAAAVLGCSSAAFLVRVSRARRRLRSHLSSDASTSPATGAYPPSTRKETASCNAPLEPT